MWSIGVYLNPVSIRAMIQRQHIVGKQYISLTRMKMACSVKHNQKRYAQRWTRFLDSRFSTNVFPNGNMVKVPMTEDTLNNGFYVKLMNLSDDMIAECTKVIPGANVWHGWCRWNQTFIGHIIKGVRKSVVNGRLSYLLGTDVKVRASIFAGGNLNSEGNLDVNTMQRLESTDMWTLHLRRKDAGASYWNSSLSYGPGDFVWYEDIMYRSLTTTTEGANPADTPAEWAEDHSNDDHTSGSMTVTIPEATVVFYL
jgi:hypothetical protein